MRVPLPVVVVGDTDSYAAHVKSDGETVDQKRVLQIGGETVGEPSVFLRFYLLGMVGDHYSCRRRGQEQSVTNGRRGRRGNFSADAGEKTIESVGTS